MKMKEKKQIKKLIGKVKERKDKIAFINVICSENEKLKEEVLSSLRGI